MGNDIKDEWYKEYKLRPTSSRSSLLKTDREEEQAPIKLALELSLQETCMSCSEKFPNKERLQSHMVDCVDEVNKKNEVSEVQQKKIQ